MNEMPSSEFRRRYASLTERTTVTVNGHVIGVWDPTREAIFMAEQEDHALRTYSVMTDETVHTFAADRPLQQPPVHARSEEGKVDGHRLRSLHGVPCH